MKRYISTIYIRFIALIVIMTLSAGAVVGQVTFEKVLNISDLSAGDITSEVPLDDFYTAVGTSGNTMTIEDNNKSLNGISFTKRLKTNGTGNSDYRYISFTAHRDGILHVYALSGKTGENRTLRLHTSVTTTDGVGQDVSVNDDIKDCMFNITNGTTYYLYSQSGGINIYYLAIAPPPDLSLGQIYVISEENPITSTPPYSSSKCINANSNVQEAPYAFTIPANNPLASVSVKNNNDQSVGTTGTGSWSGNLNQPAERNANTYYITVSQTVGSVNYSETYTLLITNTANESQQLQLAQHNPYTLKTYPANNSNPLEITLSSVELSSKYLTNNKLDITKLINWSWENYSDKDDTKLPHVHQLIFQTLYNSNPKHQITFGSDGVKSYVLDETENYVKLEGNALLLSGIPSSGHFIVNLTAKGGTYYGEIPYGSTTQDFTQVQRTYADMVAKIQINVSGTITHDLTYTGPTSLTIDENTTEDNLTLSTLFSGFKINTKLDGIETHSSDFGDWRVSYSSSNTNVLNIVEGKLVPTFGREDQDVVLTLTMNESGTLIDNLHYSNKSVEIPVTIKAATANPELESVKVNNSSLTLKDGSYYTYNAESSVSQNASYPLELVTASSETIHVSGMLRSTISSPESLSFVDVPSNVALPNTPGTSNYYCVKLSKGVKTSYFWVEVHRKAADGELEVMDHEMGWTYNYERSKYEAWTPILASENTNEKITDDRSLQNGYVWIWNNGNATKYMNVSANGIYFEGGGSWNDNPDNRNMIAGIKVLGPGTLSLRVSNSSTTNATNPNKNILIKVDDKTKLDTIPCNSSLTDYHIDRTAITSVFLYAKGGGVTLNDLIWVPDDAAAEAYIPKITLQTEEKYLIERGLSIIESVATATYNSGSVDVTTDLHYDISTSSSSAISVEKVGKNLKITGNSVIEEATITVSLPSSNDYSAASETKTIKVKVYDKVTSVKFSNVTIDGQKVSMDANNMFTYEPESPESFSASYTMALTRESSSASVKISPALRATVRNPETTIPSGKWTEINFSVSKTTTVSLPIAPGFSNYYYLQVTDDNQSATYCLRMHRKAGTGELEVWDREMGWSKENIDNCSSWTPITANQSNSNIIQNQYIKIHMAEETENFYSVSETTGLHFKTEGNMNEDVGFADMVAEIKVSGNGTLKIKRNIGTGLGGIRVGVPKANYEGIDLKTSFDIEDGFELFVYEGNAPTSIFISSDRVRDFYTLLWVPSTTAQFANQPEIIWNGIEDFVYGSKDHELKAEAYYEGAKIDDSEVSYNIIRGSKNIGIEKNGTSLGSSAGKLSLAGFHAGTVMVCATVNASGSRVATRGYYIFNIRKQRPSLVVSEIETNVNVPSEKTVKEYITAVEGIKLKINEETGEIETTTEILTIENDKELSYTASSEEHYVIESDNKVRGLKVGRTSMAITWTPWYETTENNKVVKKHNTSAIGNYLATTTNADVTVIDKNLEMVFRKSAGTGGCGRPYQADVICRDKDTKTTIKGLKIKYEIITDGFPDDVSAELNADGTAVIPGNISGTIHIKAYFVRAPKATDKNAYYDNADTGTTKYFTLTTKKIGTLTEITENSFESLNLADLIWNNETRSTGVGKEISLATAPKFMTDNYYFAKANSDVEDHDANHHHFRFYPANNDELVNSPDSPIKGLYMKSKDSYLSFYAEGSATLELQGYASVARSVEVWAVSDADWKDYADPQLNDGAVKVAIIEIPEGEFPRTEGEKTISAETKIELPGANYYFIKTNNGGIYLSKVIWKNKKEAATLTVNRNRYELTSNSDIISVMNGENGDNIIHPFVITAKKGTEEISDPEFKFSSSDESIATVNPKTGVVNPINQSPLNLDGTTRKPVTIYIDMEAGDDYAAARTSVDIIIKDKVADVFFGNGLSEISVVYAKKTNTVLSANAETGGTWLTPTIRDAETKNTLSSAAYNLEYRLEDMNGDPYTKAKIDKKTGVVTIINGATFSKDEKFRVVVKFTSDMYVNQQAYYVVKVADALTDPAVTYNSEDGMKELNRSNYDGAWGTTVWGFYKQREYFIPAEHDAKLTFTLPEPLNGLTMHAKILDNLADNPPTTGFEFESETGKNSMIVTIPAKTTKDKNNRIISYDHQVKYVWLRITRQKEDGTGPDFEDYTNIWNGAYKITFFAQPSFSVDGTSAAGSTRKVTLTSNNPRSATPGYYNQAIYSTTDSSTPTAESRKYTDTPISHTSNAVYNVVEAFVPTGGFTDGTTTFTTSVLYNQEVEILDNNVIEAKSGENNPKLAPNWNNQLLLPNGTTAKYAQLRVMMGADSTYVYKSGSTLYDPDENNNTLGIKRTDDFMQGGVVWKKKSTDPDSGIKSYVDIYKYYKEAQNFSEKAKNSDDIVLKNAENKELDNSYDSNPFTEYNGNFGGVGTHYPGSTAPLMPYMTPVSGAFFRFEPEYSGIVTVWIRQNGASATKAWSNGHNGSIQQSSFYLTRRPVFIMDEDGRQLNRNTAAYSSSWQTLSQYKDINGVAADVSLQSTLDKDFMWGWNNFNNITEDGRKRTSRYAMEFYKSKYDFYVDLDLDESGNGYVQKFDLTSDGENASTNATADGKDVDNIPIIDIIYCDNKETDLDGQSFVLGGYELPMPNYVRYRFPVTAGKTYFMGGRQTKNSFCAVKFDCFVKKDGVTPIDVVDNIEIDENSKENASEFEELKTGDVINCTLTRTFTAGYWHPIVLPFSVSETRMREIFGDEVMVLTLDSEQRYDGTDEPFTMPNAVKTISYGNIDDYNEKTADLVFTKHFYQMLYANTPAFIKPTFKWYKREKDSNGQETVIITTDKNGVPDPKYNDPFNSDAKTTITQKTSVNFNRVTYVEGGPKTVPIGHSYFLKGTYDKLEGHKGDIYYLTNEDDGSKAVIRHNNSTQYGVTFKATRCWIERSTSSTSAPTIKRVGITTFDGMGLNNEANLIATDIHDVFADVFTSNPGGDIVDWHVYNLQGIAVDCVTEERGIEAVRGELPAGIYVFQGKKMLIR